MQFYVDQYVLYILGSNQVFFFVWEKLLKKIKWIYITLKYCWFFLSLKFHPNDSQDFSSISLLSIFRNMIMPSYSTDCSFAWSFLKSLTFYWLSQRTLFWCSFQNYLDFKKYLRNFFAKVELICFSWLKIFNFFCLKLIDEFLFWHESVVLNFKFDTLVVNL